MRPTLLPRSPTLSTAKFSAAEIFRQVIFWPPCDEPCDWLPDIKIRVTQAQPGGPVVIYEDTWAQIHFNQAGDLLNLTLEANASAMYADDCHRDPILGNCMLLDAVGTVQDHAERVRPGDLPAGCDPGSILRCHARPAGSALGIPRKATARGRRTVSVYGRFGIAANVDYYQVQVARWTNADLTAWSLDHTHVPPDSAFAPVPGTALRSVFAVLSGGEPLAESLACRRRSDPIRYPESRCSIRAANASSRSTGIAHGGSDPAPSFGGWYWYYFTETRLFDLDTSQMPNGYYTFRFVGYRQTGVDGSGNPILTPVTMGLPGGVGRRCNTALPELLTLYLHDDAHVPDCAILTFTKNGPGGSSVVDECAMVTLTPADWLEVEYKAFDAAGNLGSYCDDAAEGLQRAAGSDRPARCQRDQRQRARRPDVRLRAGGCQPRDSALLVRRDLEEEDPLLRVP